MRPACETGYICSDPATGAGCGTWYERDPAGTDARWFRCPCGTIGPATQAEYDAARTPDLWGAA